MAYKGSTELSSAANPPRGVAGVNMWGQRSTSLLTSSKIRGNGLWLYNTTDGTTEIVSNTYFTDGYYLGMKEGDLIGGAICTGTSATMYFGVIGPVTTAGCGIASTNGFVSSTA